MTREELEAEYGRIISEHGQWVVTERFILAPKELYPIPRSEAAALTDGERSSEWVRHVSEKNWCRPRDLIAAIKASIATSGGRDPIDWEETTNKLIYRAYRQCLGEEADRRLGLSSEHGIMAGDVARSMELEGRLADEYWDPSRDWVVDG